MTAVFMAPVPVTAVLRDTTGDQDSTIAQPNGLSA